jgi:hypothetical protein
MNARYTRAQGRSCRHDEESSMTMEHHFRIDVFTVAVDFQLQELNNRFSEHAVELLILIAALSPQDAYKSFKIDDICNLVEKFYPQDFTKQEKIILRFQLDHYKLDEPKHSYFQNMCVKVYGTYSLSKNALESRGCLCLIKWQDHVSLSDVEHFNTLPTCSNILAKHVFNIGREMLIIVQGTYSDTMIKSIEPYSSIKDTLREWVC